MLDFHRSRLTLKSNPQRDGYENNDRRKSNNDPNRNNKRKNPSDGGDGGDDNGDKRKKENEHNDENNENQDVEMESPMYSPQPNEEAIIK